MSRFVIRRLGDGNSRVGNITIRVTMGSPIIVGIMKEANRFSFILFLKVLDVLLLWAFLALGRQENYVW